METNASFNYRAWGADNIAYGPVELPGLVTWVKQGKVTANSWVFKEKDGTWSRASEVPELKVLFKSKLPPSAAASADALGIQPGALRRIKMLADVDERLLASLLTYLEVVRVPAFGEVVRKGDHGDALFMVLEGEVRARVMIGGQETTLATMGVGECFGELAVVDQGPRSADVIANQPSVLIKVSEAALRKMFAEAPALAAPFMLALTRVIAQRVQEHDEALRGYDPVFASGGSGRRVDRLASRGASSAGMLSGCERLRGFALQDAGLRLWQSATQSAMQTMCRVWSSQIAIVPRSGAAPHFLKCANPPGYGHAGVYQQVDDSQHQPGQPAEREAKAQRMDSRVSPGSGMPQARLVARHPIVLQKPVRDQVRHQPSFEGSHRGIRTGRTAGSAESAPALPRGAGHSGWPARPGGQRREPG